MGNAADRSTSLKTTNSKRIVSNAMVLFVRMFILTIISLYAVRIVLAGLGETDYGIYNTVVGVITTSTFISSVLALSVQRFYSYSIGEGNIEKLKDIFPASMNIAMLLALTVLVIFEIVGVWLVGNQLTIPEERMSATMQAFQYALFSFVFSLLQIPFSAAIFAHEDMGIYALVSMVECFLKLGAAFLMSQSTSFDHLSYYAALLMLVSIAVMCSYMTISRKRYAECRYQKVRTNGLHKSLLSFSTWAFLGPLANVGIIQGNMILLNIFFGPLINASFGIALQINNAINSLSNCIIIAIRPALIKSYADNNIAYVTRLFYIANKLLYYGLIAIGIPLFFEMDTILHLWLNQVSETTVLFSRLIIIYMICMAMNAPITTIVQATGKVKEYHLPVESITLLCIPTTLVLFMLRYPAWSVFCSMTGICIIAHIVRLFCLRNCYASFSIRQYVISLCAPAIIITLLTSISVYALHSYILSHAPLRLASVVLGSIGLIICLTYSIGMNTYERLSIHQFITSKLAPANGTGRI